MSAPDEPRDLGGGLVLRQATPADAARLAESQAHGFRDAPDAPPNPWDRALLLERGNVIIEGSPDEVVATYQERSAAATAERDARARAAGLDPVIRAR